MTDETVGGNTYNVPNPCCGKMTLSSIVKTLGLCEMVIWLLVTLVLTYFLGSAVYENNGVQRSYKVEYNQTEAVNQTIGNQTVFICPTMTKLVIFSMENATLQNPGKNDTLQDLGKKSTEQNSDSSQNDGKNDVTSIAEKRVSTDSAGLNKKDEVKPMKTKRTTDSQSSSHNSGETPPSANEDTKSDGQQSHPEEVGSNTANSEDTIKTAPPETNSTRSPLATPGSSNTSANVSSTVPTATTTSPTTTIITTPETHERNVSEIPVSSAPTIAEKTSTEADELLICVSQEDSDPVKKIIFTSVWLVFAVSHIIVGRSLVKVSKQVRSRKVRVWVLICVIQTLGDVVMFGTSLAELVETTLVVVFLTMYLVHRLYFFWGLVSFYWTLP